MVGVIERLYKTVFWASLAVMLYGVGYNIFETIRRSSYADYSDAIIYRSTNPNIPTGFLYSDLTDFEKDVIIQDKKNSLIKLFFEYNLYRFEYYFYLISQFICLILVKKWLVWVVSGSKSKEPLPKIL